MNMISQIATEKKENFMLNMEINESRSMDDGVTHVLRVHGGWIYTLYHPYEVCMDGRWSTEFRATSTFVPLYPTETACKSEE